MLLRFCSELVEYHLVTSLRKVVVKCPLRNPDCVMLYIDFDSIKIQKLI